MPHTLRPGRSHIFSCLARVPAGRLIEKGISLCYERPCSFLRRYLKHRVEAVMEPCTQHRYQRRNVALASVLLLLRGRRSAGRT